MNEVVHAFPTGRQDASQFIEQIYLAAAQPERWQQVLHDLVSLTGSRSARMLILDDTASTVLTSLKVNTDDSAHQRYVDYYVNTCPWRTELARKPGGQLYSTYLHFSCKQSSFYRTEFFNDWARDLDIHHGVCGTIDEDAEQKVQLLIQRTRGQGPYTQQETGAINSLVPHIRRALFINRSIAEEQVKRDAITQAMLRYRLPFFLMDQRGRIHWVSPDAEQLVRRGVLPAPRNGVLQCESSLDSQRLQRLVRRCLGTAIGGTGGAGGELLAHRSTGNPVRLIVMPLHPEMQPTAWMPRNGAFAAVFVHDPDMIPEIDQAELARLHDLTEAEARVAAAVARGESLESVAAAVGTSVHTVRAQLKAAMRKTGTRRQAALARQILLGPACRMEPAAMQLRSEPVQVAHPRQDTAVRRRAGHAGPGKPDA